MPALRLRAIVCGAATLAAACSGSGASRAADHPPPAEFLLSSVDSTFWVVTGSGPTRVRGEPLVLARVDGRFYELFASDVDHSYDDAILVGERLYRRDITTGDSLLVFSDTTVARLTDEYARAHPDERPLAPDDEGEANPSTSATAEVDVLGVLGPFVSYEYHVDVTQPHVPAWHSTRRGVIDLRTGKEAAVSDIVGAAAGQRVVTDGRAAFQSVRDSLARARPTLSGADRIAAEVFARLTFDERSFSLEIVDDTPSVTFGIPGRGVGGAGNVVELDPIPVDSMPAWGEVRSLFARGDSLDDDRWDHGAVHVLARYDTSGEIAHVSIADAKNREWPLATIAAPLSRVVWLDQPALSPGDRRALERAFNQAASYGENSRVAMRPTHGRLGRLRLAALKPSSAARHLSFSTNT